MAIWTARQIWASMTREQREKAALSLWEDPNITRQTRTTALAPWLHGRGLRPTFFEQLPRTRRAQIIAEGGVPEDTAAQLLMSFHLVQQRALLGRFLDELGIKHEDGLIKEGEEPDPPTAEAVERGVAALRANFPGVDVDVYLRTLTATDPETWAAIVPFAGDPA